MPPDEIGVSATPGRRRARALRSRTVAAVGVAVAALVTGTLVIDDPGPGASADAAVTAPVVRTDLRRVVTLAGAVHHGGERTLVARGAAAGADEAVGESGGAVGGAVGGEVGGEGGGEPAAAAPAGGRSGGAGLGTLTWSAAVGDVLGVGDVAWSIDGEPTVVLHGDVPSYRSLDVGVADGTDVEQVEAALVELGYGEGLSPDGHYDAATAAAVAEWERHLGRTADGVVGLGEVVVQPDTVRVQDQLADVGSEMSDGSGVLAVASTTPVVEVAVPEQYASSAVRGAVVTVGFGDGTRLVAVVDRELPAVTRGTDGWDSHVDVAFADPSVVPAVADGATVEVELLVTEVRGAIAVPAGALRAGHDGEVVVLAVGPGGASREVPIETGVVQDGLVEVVGGAVDEGDVLVLS